MNQDLAATRIFLQKGVFEKVDPPNLAFTGERDRFRTELVEIDKILSEQTLSIGTAKRLIQGPLSNLITHIGQISMMQRLAENQRRPLLYLTFLNKKMLFSKLASHFNCIYS